MNELELVEHLKKRARRKRRELILGIGDDAAVYRVPGATEDLLFTTDLMVESVHFRSTDAPDHVGRKALARGLSDIAAMGGEPRFCLVSLALPASQTGFVERFYDGLLAVADRTRTVLAGGDLSRSKTITCDVVVCGSLPSGTSLCRDGARHGNSIWVSGPLGRAASRQYRDLPEPRLDIGRKLRGRATACMDLSDGLSIDLHRLCLASGVCAELETVPVFPGATQKQALDGGEDYELLFTTSHRTAPKGCIRIGSVRHGEPGAIYLGGKRLRVGGHDHFAKRS